VVVDACWRHARTPRLPSTPACLPRLVVCTRATTARLAALVRGAHTFAQRSGSWLLPRDKRDLLYTAKGLRGAWRIRSGSVARSMSGGAGSTNARSQRFACANVLRGLDTRYALDKTPIQHRASLWFARTRTLVHLSTHGRKGAAQTCATATCACSPAITPYRSLPVIAFFSPSAITCLPRLPTCRACLPTFPTPTDITLPAACYGRTTSNRKSRAARSCPFRLPPAHTCLPSPPSAHRRGHAGGPLPYATRTPFRVTVARVVLLLLAHASAMTCSPPLLVTLPPRAFPLHTTHTRCYISLLHRMPPPGNTLHCI